MNTTSVENVFSTAGFADSGKLLIVFEAADRKKVRIEDDYIDSYIFLLNADKIVPFGYHFRFAPLPYSGLLKEDLYALVQAEYLDMKSNIHITDFGKDWVEEELRVSKHFHNISEEIGNKLKLFSTWGPYQLFEAIYVKVTSISI